MSNSVSDQQVEDVLSSVRRLVSSDLPRKPRVRVPDGPGALVLTDAQRVESLVPVAPEPRKTSLEQRVAELEAVLQEQDGEFEPDGSEDQAQHRPDRIVFTRPPRSPEDSARRPSSQRLSQIALVETGPANEAEADDQAASPASEPSFTSQAAGDPEPEEVVAEAPMAEDVPLEPRPSAEVRAFRDPEEVLRNFEARIAAGRQISEPLPLAETESPKKEGEDFDAALSEAVAASLPSSEADETAKETEASQALGEDTDAVSEFDPSIFSADTPDPQVSASVLLSTSEEEDTESVGDTLSADEFSFSVPHPDAAPEPEQDQNRDQDVLEATAPVESEIETSDAGVAVDGEDDPHPAAQQAPEAAADQAEAALAALPDEEAMQLLVARMIRAELQGELGERITRNVRKLVRQEIKRAMTSRDLS